MAKHIAVANFKGGVGKTTTTAFLAHAYQRIGKSVAVVDTDSQQSLITWANLGEWSIPKFYIDPTRRDFPQVLADLTSSYEVVLIDTPPVGDDLNSRGATVLRWVDQAVIPMAPSGMDISRVKQTYDAIEQVNPDLDVRVLFTQVVHNARATRDARKVLTSKGRKVVRATIPQREAVRQAFGTSPTRMHNYDTVMEELER